MTHLPKMTPGEPIAVIGSACRFPGDCDKPSKLWEILKSPPDLLRQVPPERYDADAFYHPDPMHHGTTNVRQSYFLNENVSSFDNGFFNIQAAEAEAIDPQQRILMETVYDSLCAAGQTIEDLRGSPTSVYVGLMCDDWSGVIAKDLDVFAQYAATGMARSIMSNRISYFFDWHGPSMTIDTACSSSLVAVHQAIQTLRGGESQVAIAAGANLILTPDMYVAESKLSMLSPTGRSRMWDKDVDGYARGEGLAAVVLKPLSAAIRDNDNIECLIRATGVNQDGRTQGITKPSATTQADLIRNTYARAGLDINKPEDRPQFFHAHGTGTAAGDPQEAEAIATAFYSSSLANDKLYVGSIKTVIGHTEGTAGLASLIGTSLALKHRTIPPNLHFNTLNPRLAPFYHNLEVPTQAVAWPEPLPGQPCRASINSFGFGGTNAHAILEAYEAPTASAAQGSLVTPLTFSASSETSLRSMLSEYSEYLKSKQPESLHDLAYTLQSRRSTLAYRLAITAFTADDASSQIDAILSGDMESTMSTRQLVKTSPKILAIFTGQGSQWPRMGVRMLEESPYAAKRFSELDQALVQWPVEERPTWTLREMILADAESSRMNEAAISQPLCTAVQIVLVDLLKLAGVELQAVVGHSSGEIGAAYAAGLISAHDAIKTAYYRGLFAKLAASPNGGKGAMMAVGTTIDDASEFCGLKDFEGRIQIAAVNSSSSLTLSGDEDAVAEAIEIFKEEGKFARQLKVDTAYHSSHVLPCTGPYLAALEGSGLEAVTPTGAKWYSSVRQGEVMSGDSLSFQYWVDNMTNPVLFSPAVKQAWAESGPFDLVLEVGPHPVLRTPCLDSVEEIAAYRPPYSGLLTRGKDDIREFSNALGFIWTHLGPHSVSFDAFARAVSKSPEVRRLVTDLPKYPFDHSRKFMSLSRVSGLHHSLKTPPHPLLGKRCHDREAAQSVQWRNVLSPTEIPWLHGHQIQSQIVFPATGYIAMAVEAVATLAGASNITLLSIEDLRIGRAMTFSDDDSSVEVIFDINIINRSETEIQAQFSCNSGAPRDHRSIMALNASGLVTVNMGKQQHDLLPVVETDMLNTSDVAVDRFYEFLNRLGFNYSWPFHGTTSIRRRADYAVGMIEDQSGTDWEDQLIVHPGMLDTALQTTFAAFCCPGDERMWALHVPISFKSIVINPYYTSIGIGKQKGFQYQSVAGDYNKGKAITELNLFSEETGHTFIQIEGMQLVPFSPALPENDIVLFSRFDYKIADPDCELAAVDYTYKPNDLEIAIDSERISFYYLRRLLEVVTSEEKAQTLWHYRNLLDWAAYVVPKVLSGNNAHIPVAAKHDTQADIEALVQKFVDPFRHDKSVGENLPQVIRDRSNILEHMTKDGMLDDVYEEGFGLSLVNEYLTRVVSQISHRYPRMNILEIGAGTGGSTRRILPSLGSAFSTYTYTDVSSGFFGKAQDRLSKYEDRMIFKTFDMNESPSSQGFVEGAYDMVIASNVLHATLTMEEMMTHVRRLLKPGGYVIILETVHSDCLRVGLPMGSLPGWWLGAETGRRWGPTLTLPQWDSLLRKCGFDGIDSTTPPMHRILPGHVFCAQAIDERVTMLRTPLAEVTSLPATKAPQLVIVGGETLSVHRLCEKVSHMLSPRFERIARLSSVAELATLGLTESSTVLCLMELDDPLFANMTEQKMDGLKTLWRQGRNILWVTKGARAENPYSYMTVGIGRCIRFEHPNITLQVLDVDRLNDRLSGIVAEHLLRLELLDKWSRELRPDELMWSLEPEIYIENDIAIIPRLYQYETGNKRYNTSRRIVHEEINPQDTTLLFTGGETTWEVQRASPLHIAMPLAFNVDKRTINVTHFLLSTVQILPGCRLMLCAGVDAVSKERFLMASHTAESPVTIPSSWCLCIDGVDPIAALAGVSAYMAACSIMQLVHRGDTVVILDLQPLVVTELEGMMKDEQCTLAIMTSNQEGCRDGWQYVDENLPERTIRCLLPSTTTKFIDFSAGSVSGERIARSLPRSCEIIDATRVLSTHPKLRPLISEQDVSSALQLSFSKIDALIERVGPSSGVSTVPVESLTSDNKVGAKFAIADCTNTSIVAAIQPIDGGNIFSPDKTYFLVGLTGELGQSLCKWMVVHGARYIALSSRKPNLDPRFISGMEHMGATVKTFPMDITSRESLHGCYKSILQSMPPIAGVTNGAMVMDDSLFEKMSYESFLNVVAPKVRGSQLLDELFHDTPLDFFIFFSSAAAVMGNSGQSNYIAGNMFMNALAAQRKNRGVAASSIAISSVIGLGYVERAEDLSAETFTKMGYRPMSEQDLQKLFAEGIVLGRPGSLGVCELSTGVAPIYTDSHASDQYLKDVKFGHFVLERMNTLGQGTGASSISVRLQLAEAKTMAAAVSIIQESFLVRLRRILAVAADESVNENVTLIEQGVDSLMAVEVRSWFLKELDVDIPVLKILGGSSVRDLLEEALKLLPASIVDLSTLDAGQEQAAKPTLRLVHQFTGSDETIVSSGLASSSDNSTTGSARQLPAGLSTPMTPLHLSSSTASLKSVKPDETQGSADYPNSPVQLPDESTSVMSFGQAGFWVLNEYLADKKAMNMAVMLRLNGRICTKTLETAVQVIGTRHEILRTRFFWSGEGDEGVPMQGISSKSMIKLITKQIVSENDADAELKDMHNTAWDLTGGNTIKLSLLSLSNETHFLVLGAHHIILDGYSFSVFFKDLDAAYQKVALPSLNSVCQYRSFAVQQRQMVENGDLDDAIAHYRQSLPSISTPIALLPLAKTTTRQAMERYKQNKSTVRIEAGLAARLRQVARKNRATSFHVYLSTLQALLFRLLPDTDDIFIGIADAGRLDKNFMNSIGFFLNLLPLRFQRRQPGTTGSSAIQAARDAVYSALRHSKLPFDVLLRELNIPRSSEYTPLFQVFVDYRQVVQERSTFAGCKLNGEKWANAGTGYDISLEIMENVNVDTTISLHLQDTLYSEENTQLLLRSYVKVLESMVDAPEAAVDSISIWASQDVDAALTVGKALRFVPEWKPTLSHQIDDNIVNYSSKIALKDGNGNVLTYRQMGSRVSAITDALRAAGTTKDTIVGVFQEPSSDWICSMLAVFRTGGVYVPLDLRNSIPRLSAITKVARPTVIIADNSTTSHFKLIGADNATEILVTSIAPSATPLSIQRNDANPDSQALILFTSGSTGEPKGLMMTHRNLSSSAEAASRTFTKSPDGSFVVLQQSAFSFDLSLDQIFAALAGGGCLYVVPDRHRGDPVEISKTMVNERVTYTTATPSEYDMWLRYGATSLRQCSSWTHAFSGGETMRRGLVDEFAALQLPGLHLFNGYGPAETTMFSTRVELAYTEPGLPDPLPAGFMLASYSVCIVDVHGKIVPLGFPGEIVISGPGVVSGYLGNPEATSKKFMSDTYFGTPYKVYRSGDRGRLQRDGSLFCDGRLEGDSQVKLRGFRIELSEIEKVLLMHASGALTHAVVTLRGSGDSRYLAAHVVFSAKYPKEGRDKMIQTLRRSLPLPSYMQPAIITTLAHIPRTLHNKVDRRAIKEMPLSRPDDDTSASVELTSSEHKLSELWREVLPVNPGLLSSESDFFLVGGNSILLVKLKTRISKAFAAAPMLIALMGSSSLGGMAAAIEASRPGGSIDWEVETSLPESLRPLATPNRAPRTEGLVVLLTGASGYLGRHLLARFVADRKIARVIMLLRKTTADQEHTETNGKATAIRADVSQANFGLSDDAFVALAEAADVIVHCAANRSFWDSYEVLRPMNLDSVKELTRLALRGGLPLHFLSSGSVAKYTATNTFPPSDGSDGYVSTKWAAEAFLRQAAAELNVPVYIHRPVGISGSEHRDIEGQAAVLEALSRIMKKLALRPSFEGVGGSVDLVPVDRVVEDIDRSAISSTASCSGNSSVTLLHHKAVLRVFVNDLAMEVHGSDHLRNLPSLPILDWFGKAKMAGFEYFMAAQDLAMGSENGGLVSRR